MDRHTLNIELARRNTIERMAEQARIEERHDRFYDLTRALAASRQRVSDLLSTRKV
jgi:hypothetical protein